MKPFQTTWRNTSGKENGERVMSAGAKSSWKNIEINSACFAVQTRMLNELRMKTASIIIYVINALIKKLNGGREKSLGLKERLVNCSNEKSRNNGSNLGDHDDYFDLTFTLFPNYRKNTHKRSKRTNHRR